MRTEHPSALRQAMREAYRIDETTIVDELVRCARFTPEEQQRILDRARPLVQNVRDSRLKVGGLDAFLNTYDLSSREGIVLMCMAEALLRIPDTETMDLLIRDKIGNTEWEKRLGASHSLFVNAGTWALMLTGRIVKLENDDRNLGGTFKRLVARTGEPVIRQAIITAMRILGKQFVMGRNIDEAVARAQSAEKNGYRHSYDMLGEAARTTGDALKYFETYMAAIKVIGTAAQGRPALEAPSVSIKLSALHPRYEVANEERVRRELWPAVKALALQAKRMNIGFTIDAEEMDRLEISLDLIESLALDQELAGWDGLGVALQSYQKRALATVDWLADLAHRAKRRLMVRLVKGAYWDAEIKLAQERGLSDYPVFTRKASTDVSYLACVRRLFADPVAFYPAFATHNAHTLAAIFHLAGERWQPGEYELRLKYLVDSLDRNEKGLRGVVWLENRDGGRSSVYSTTLRRNRTENFTRRFTVDTTHRRLHLDFLDFREKPLRPSVTVTGLEIDYIPTTSVAVDSLYRQQLDLRIFADEFLRAAIQADSL